MTLFSLLWKKLGCTSFLKNKTFPVEANIPTQLCLSASAKLLTKWEKKFAGSKIKRPRETFVFNLCPVFHSPWAVYIYFWILLPLYRNPMSSVAGCQNKKQPAVCYTEMGCPCINTDRGGWWGRRQARPLSQVSNSLALDGGEEEPYTVQPRGNCRAE